MVEIKTVNDRLEELLGMGLLVRMEKTRAPGVGDLLAIYQDGKEVLNVKDATYTLSEGSDLWKSRIGILAGAARMLENVDESALEADLANNTIHREHRLIYQNNGDMWTFDYPAKKYFKQ